MGDLILNVFFITRPLLVARSFFVRSLPRLWLALPQMFLIIELIVMYASIFEKIKEIEKKK